MGEHQHLKTTDITGKWDSYCEDLNNAIFIVEDRLPIPQIKGNDVWVDNPKSGFISKQEWDRYKHAEKELSGLVNPTEKDIEGFEMCFLHRWPKDGDLKCYTEMVLLHSRRDGEPVYERFSFELGKTKFKIVESHE